MLTTRTEDQIQTSLQRLDLARQFEVQFSDWFNIAKVCFEIERDRDYELLGYSSWNTWLLQEMPRSRSYIYLVVGRYKELSPDIPESELAQIPLGSTAVLRQLSPAVRQMSKIRQGARLKPAEFRKIVADLEPGQHIEPIVDVRFRFTLSFWERFEAAYETYRLTDETASKEDFIEWILSETD